LIRAVVEMKQRNPGWGCPRIAEQIALAFGVPINKDVVRRILAMHYQSPTDGAGPSWLTFLGHMKDCLWSTDLFRCESMTLRTYWVLVVMDQYSRALSDLEFRPESSMALHSAGCSIKRFESSLFRSI
jgi:hypothetical protein